MANYHILKFEKIEDLIAELHYSPYMFICSESSNSAQIAVTSLENNQPIEFYIHNDKSITAVESRKNSITYETADHKAIENDNLGLPTAKCIKSSYDVVGILEYDNPFEAISYNVFLGSNVSSVFIPEGVTFLQNDAFKYCNSLGNLQIPKSLEFVGEWAINACNFTEPLEGKTHSLKLESNIKNICELGFAYTNSLGTIEICPTSEDCGTYIDTFAFVENWNMTDVSLGKGISFIGDLAFGYSKCLGTLTIPEGVQYIDEFAFTCRQDSTIQKILKTVNFPKHIGMCNGTAFLATGYDSSICTEDSYVYCPSEKFTGIPNSIKRLESNFLINNYSVSKINANLVPNNITSIGRDVIADSDEQTTNVYCHYQPSKIIDGIYTISDGMKSIAGGCFLGANTITEIRNIPKEMEYCEDYVCSRCSSLLKFDIHNNIKYIGYSAFNECNFSGKLELPDNIEFIGKYAFYNNKITSLKLPNNPKYKFISKSCFCGNSNLNSVILPNNIETIQNYAFSSCSNLSNITWSNNLKYIGNYAFSNCKLETLEIPDSVICINKSAFYGSNIKHLKIGKNYNFLIIFIHIKETIW